MFFLWFFFFIDLGEVVFFLRVDEVFIVLFWFLLIFWLLLWLVVVLGWLVIRIGDVVFRLSKLRVFGSGVGVRRSRNLDKDIGIVEVLVDRDLEVVGVLGEILGVDVLLGIGTFLGKILGLIEMLWRSGKFFFEIFEADEVIEILDFGREGRWIGLVIDKLEFCRKFWELRVCFFWEFWLILIFLIIEGDWEMILFFKFFFKFLFKFFLFLFLDNLRFLIYWGRLL